jgi:hypothetical protein
VPGDEMTRHELAHDGPAGRASGADPREPAGGTGPAAADTAGADAVSPAGAADSPGGWPACSGMRRSRRTPGLWLSIFGVSLGLFIVRFLVPAPVGQADNRDGPRLMCSRGLGLGPVVPRGDPRFFRYAYFEYVPIASCGRHGPYPTSEIVPLELARLLTPALGLPGTLNLIALGLLMCAITSVAIASLATGLRIRTWAQLLVAATIWLIMADAAFFDVFASPFSEPAVLIGVPLVAAGVVYLGRGGRATVFGLLLAGSGGFLAVLAKEQYLPLAVPICLTLVLASVNRDGGPGLRRFLTRQTGAAVAVAAVLALMTAASAVSDVHSSYGQRTQPMRAVDTIFERIMHGNDNKLADLHALGLPGSWARYAGHYYWDRGSVRTSPLYSRYEAKLADGNIVHFLLTHPGRIIGVGQQAAAEAQLFRVNALGDYPPAAGHQPGAVESRVIVVTWLMHRLPRHLGLLWLVPLWTAMAAVAIAALIRRRRSRWHRDGAVLVLCMTGCAIAAFIPPAYFDGISTTRHMIGMNLATVLAFAISIALAASMILQALDRALQPRSLTSAGQGLGSRLSPRVAACRSPLRGVLITAASLAAVLAAVAVSLRGGILTCGIAAAAIP